MNNFSLNKPMRVRLAAAVALLGIGVCGAFYSESLSKTLPFAEAEISSTPRNGKLSNYTRFEHSSKAHRLECGTCHKFPSDNWKKVRSEKDAFPDVTEYPKHESCLNCHRQQFFRGATPQICSICHTNKFPPRNSARWPFPNPREVFDTSSKGKAAVSDFSIGFPHDKHIEIVSKNRSSEFSLANASFVRSARAVGEESCVVCHTTFKPQGESDDEYVTKPPAKLGDDFWLKKGTFKTTPIGHTTCFTCHSADTGILPAAK